MEIGQRASIQKRFTEDDILAFSKLSFDTNPIHFDEEYAKKTRFGTRIVQGKLVSSLFSGLLGVKLPGKGTIYLSQETSFKKPVYIDELVTAYVEVESIKKEKNIITLRTWIENEKGDLVVDGKAVVLHLKDQL